MKTIIVVHDELGARGAQPGLSPDDCYEVRHVEGAGGALRLLEAPRTGPVVLDIRMSGHLGRELLARVRGLYPHVAAILHVAPAAFDAISLSSAPFAPIAAAAPPRPPRAARPHGQLRRAPRGPRAAVAAAAPAEPRASFAR
ncbi:MAG: hypothetical protein FJ291_34280 [Planctomycetes bacterium]|nr:hypothetical protein [Planctomycetota bacterium]